MGGKNSGRRPNANKKNIQKKPVIKKVELKDPVFSDLSPTEDFSKDIDSLKSRIANETTADLVTAAPPESVPPVEPESQVQEPAPGPVQIAEPGAWRPPSKEQIEQFEPLANMGLRGAGKFAEYIKKNPAANIPENIRKRMTPGMAALMAVYLPDQTAMTEKQMFTMMMVVGIVDPLTEWVETLVQMQPAKPGAKKLETSAAS